MKRIALFLVLAAPMFASGCEAVLDRDQPAEVVYITYDNAQGLPYWVQ